MRSLLALLIALALSVLPVSGLATAARADAPASCHSMPADHAMPNDMEAGSNFPSEKGAACAEHCMMQVTAHTLSRLSGPAIANAIGAQRIAHIEPRYPRAADPPETPPPRA